MSKYFHTDYTADNGIYDFYIYEEEETSLYEVYDYSGNVMYSGKWVNDSREFPKMHKDYVAFVHDTIRNVECPSLDDLACLVRYYADAEQLFFILESGYPEWEEV